MFDFRSNKVPPVELPDCTFSADLCCRHALYGVVSAQIEKVLELFLEREAAEAMIREVQEDGPERAEDLRVETIELD